MLGDFWGYFPVDFATVKARCRSNEDCELNDTHFKANSAVLTIL
jgi:hypothetical protein